MGILSNLIASGGLSKTVDSVAGGLDGLITSKEEKLQLRNELEKLLVADRTSARDMYTKDSWLQKTYALTYLVGYFAFMFYLIHWLLSSGDLNVVPEWGTILISSIFGAMTAKIGTVTDFLFGGSKQQEPNIHTKK